LITLEKLLKKGVTSNIKQNQLKLKRSRDDWEKNYSAKRNRLIFILRRSGYQKKKQDVEINEVLKVVGDTAITIEKTYRNVYADEDEAVMMLRLEQNTKMLQGKFIVPMTFQNTGIVYNLNWFDIPETISFEHKGRQIKSWRKLYYLRYSY